MVMCAPDCICKWCMLSEIAGHPQFKERIDALLVEFAPIFIEKRKNQPNKNYYYESD